MACEVDIFFDDTATVTFAGTGTAANPITATAAVSAGTTSTYTANGDGSFTLDNQVDTPVTIPAPTAGGTGNTSTYAALANGTFQLQNGAGQTFILDPNVCSASGGNGLTGTPSGIFTDGCTAAALGGTDPESAGFDPDDFGEWWRQPFTGGVTGSELWVVMADVNGALQWHQIA